LYFTSNSDKLICSLLAPNDDRALCSLPLTTEAHVRSGERKKSRPPPTDSKLKAPASAGDQTIVRINNRYDNFVIGSNDVVKKKKKKKKSSNNNSNNNITINNSKK
jgi:hypothetical protein